MLSRPGKLAPAIPEEPTKIKILCIGDTKVGKTAFIKRLIDDKNGFPDDYDPTVGSDYFMKPQRTASGFFQMNFWDLSGDRDYAEVRNEFYKESQVMLLMFDCTRKGTFENLAKWQAEAEANAGEHL